jgi:hypothetical protein
LASLVARMISRPLYSTMSLLMMRSIREPAPLDGAGIPTAPERSAPR